MRDRQHEATPKAAKPRQRNGTTGRAHDAVAGIGRIDGAEVGAEDELREIGQHHLEAEGDQQRVEHRERTIRLSRPRCSA